MTAVGGHVGWPVGWRPWVHRWKFQNTLILEFCKAVATTKKHDGATACSGVGTDR